MDEVLEFVSPSHPGIECLDVTTGVMGIDKHDYTTTPYYQLIDKDQKATKEGQIERTYDFLSCGCID